MTIKKPADLATAVVLLLGLGLVYRESFNINTGLNYALGPLFFPYVLMSLLALLCISLGLQSIDFKGEKKSDEKAARFDLGVLLLQLAVIGLVVIYLILLPIVGYVASTLGFLFLCMLLLGKRTARQVSLYVLVTCIVTGGLYFIFSELLSLFLP